MSNKNKITQRRITQMNMIISELDYLSDVLAECILSIRTTNYDGLTEQEKRQVHDSFMQILKHNNIQVTNIVIKQAQREFEGSPLSALLQEYYNKHLSVFSECYNSLTPSQKVTIIKHSFFGQPVSINTTIQHVKVEPYAQYDESLNIIHRPKRKRTLYSNRILATDKMIIYDGWLNVDIRSIINEVIEDNDKFTVTKTKYLSFDEQALIAIKNSIDQIPIISFNVK